MTTKGACARCLQVAFDCERRSRNEPLDRDVQSERGAGEATRPIREFHNTTVDRMGNALATALARSRLGPLSPRDVRATCPQGGAVVEYLAAGRAVAGEPRAKSLKSVLSRAEISRRADATGARIGRTYP